MENLPLIFLDIFCVWKAWEAPVRSAENKTKTLNLKLPVTPSKVTCQLDICSLFM